MRKMTDSLAVRATVSPSTMYSFVALIPCLYRWRDSPVIARMQQRRWYTAVVGPPSMGVNSMGTDPCSPSVTTTLPRAGFSV